MVALHVFSQAPNGDLLHKYTTPNGWGPTPLGGALEVVGPGIAGDPTAVAVGNVMHIFARAPNGDLLHKYATPTDGWGPTPLGGALEVVGPGIAGDPTAVAVGNVMHIFARAPNGDLLHKYATPNGWGPTPLGGALEVVGPGIAGDPTAVAVGNVMHIFARAPNGDLLHKYATPNGWGPTPLGGALRLIGPGCTGDPAAVEMFP